MVTITRSACDHAHTELRNTAVATCTEAGYTGDIYCTDCGEKLQSGTAIDALGHKYTSKVTTQPTVLREGVRTYTCERCGHSYTEKIPNLKVPGRGQKLTDTKSKATYVITKAGLKGGEVTYTGTTNKNATTISVPGTITVDKITYKVTAIGDNALSGNKKITKVTMGQYVTKIGTKAFYKCTKLKTVTIGKKVATIGTAAFSGCSKLTTLNLGSNVTTISDQAFSGCTSLTKLTIPAQVKKIGKEAFSGCSKLKNITIKTTKLTQKTVGSKAFQGIYEKATILVPKTKLESYTSLLKARGVSKKAVIKASK